MLRKLYSLKQKIIEKWNVLRQDDNTICIYMFHRVTNQLCSEYADISVSIQAFERFIDRKMDEGITFISIEQLEEKKNYMGRKALITFDDMFEDSMLHAVPILQKRCVPYTVFVTPGLVDLENYITSQQLETLKRDELCTLGGHTQAHSLLRKVSLKRKQIEISRTVMEDFLGISVNCFAYPYGSIYACDKESRRLVGQEYVYGFSTLKFPLTWAYFEKNKDFLPRINVNEGNCETV